MKDEGVAVTKSRGSRAPRPAPPSPVKRWFKARKSPFPWEQEGLDHVRRLMPATEPYRAWATFSFTAVSGRVNECDLFIATPGGLYLVELKGHQGRLENRGATWQYHGPDRVRTMTNPLHLTDLKSKELKTRLQRAADMSGVRGLQIPRITPAIFLSDRTLDSRLDEFQQAAVYGRDDIDTGLPWIWRDLLSRPPQRESWRITPRRPGAARAGVDAGHRRPVPGRTGRVRGPAR